MLNWWNLVWGCLADAAMVMSYRLCHITGMEPGNDLRTADRDTLIALIVQQRDMIIRQQAIIESLEKRVAPLEARAKSKGAGRMPGLKPKLNRS